MHGVPAPHKSICHLEMMQCGLAAVAVMHYAQCLTNPKANVLKLLSISSSDAIAGCGVTHDRSGTCCPAWPALPWGLQEGTPTHEAAADQPSRHLCCHIGGPQDHLWSPITLTLPPHTTAYFYQDAQSAWQLSCGAQCSYTICEI